MLIQPAKNSVMKNNFKIKLSENDFILVEIRYNYFIIPMLVFSKMILKA